MIKSFQLSVEQLKFIGRKLPTAYRIVPFRSHLPRTQPAAIDTIPRNANETQKKYLPIVFRLKKLDCCKHFIKIPFDPSKQEHIDLYTVEQNIKKGSRSYNLFQPDQYSSVLQFWADVRKIW